MNSLNKIPHALAVAVLLVGGNAVYADTAGHVQFVNGEVQLIAADGKTHGLQKGDVINEGDTVLSAKAASAQIKMQDGGFVAVRPDTKLKFDSFKFSGKEDGTEQSFYSLFKGGFRAVTGLIGRINKPSYRITTPAATIGIRGTDLETFMVVPGSELAAVAPAGTYNKVNLGETYMTTDKGTIFILPNQMGFAGAKDQMPKIQPINTDLFTVVPAPTQQAKSEVTEEIQQVRVTAVVDSTAQEQPAGSALTTAATGNAATTNIIQLPIATTGGASLTGGGAGALPVQGQGGIAFFETNTANGISFGFGDTVSYTSGLIGMSAFTSTTGGYSGTIGTATVVDYPLNGVPLMGTETLSWGRWAGTGATVTSPQGVTIPVFNLMYVGGSPVPLMPVTGIANYLPVGGTGPIDSLGNVGQFTGATVQANFAAASLAVGMNLSFGGVAYAANGSGRYATNGVIPVTSFTTVSCAPACVSGATGQYAGAFVGTNATGLGLVYHVTNTGSGLDIAGAQGFVRQ